MKASRVGPVFLVLLIVTGLLTVILTNLNTVTLFLGIHPATKPPTGVASIAAIAASMKGQKATVEARIIDRYVSAKNNTFLTVQDGSGTLKVVIFANTSIDASALKVGESFSFTGEIDQYQGSMEIIPERQSDIVPLN